MKEHLAEETTFNLTKGPGDAPADAERPVSLHVLTFIALFCLWIILSGKFDLFHMSLGVISCAIVSILSGDLLFSQSKTKGVFRQWFRVIVYIPWLLYQVGMANLYVLYLVFHPRMMELIDPQIIRFDSTLQKEISLVAFANAITLTPGTITMYVSINGTFHVHAIDQKSGEPLPGEMEKRVARAFEDG